MGTYACMTSGDYTPGDHVYQYEMTPAEFRPRWFLSDVPEFVRIDHPNRPAAKEGNAGGGYKGAETRARKRAADAKPPKPVKMAPPVHTGGQKGHPVFVYKDGRVTGYPSLVIAKAAAGFTFGAYSGPDFRGRGWVQFPRSGIVVWRQDVDTPSCVPRGFDFVKQGASA